MKDKKKSGYDPKKTYWDLDKNKTVTGREANVLLRAAPNPDVEALILLTIVSKRLKGGRK